MVPFDIVMGPEIDQKAKRIYKLVLTGGPCGGKTTGQARLSTFFENLGWKVFRVPEAATILLSGGVKFSDLTPEEAFTFQENLLKTMIQIENTFFELAESCARSVLIICDRGAMDASAFIPLEKWDRIMRNTGWNSVELRDNRYNQIVHMVTAADGAEDFYTVEDHACRSEGEELARELDRKAASAWIGHPYFDVIDNSSDFEMKINRMIACVCQKMAIDTGDRLLTNSRKRKFLVVSPLPPESAFPAFQDFQVVHNYLVAGHSQVQTRLRKRGQRGNYSYTHTIRKLVRGQIVEVKTRLNYRDYVNMLSQKDGSHFTVFKKRRCFLYDNQYFQLDIYQSPCHPRCDNLILLETYSALGEGQLEKCLPKFLKIAKEVTGDPNYSMFNLSLKEEWNKTTKFCHHVYGTNNDLEEFQPKLNGISIKHSDELPKTNGITSDMNHKIECSN